MGMIVRGPQICGQLGTPAVGALYIFFLLLLQDNSIVDIDMCKKV